MDAATKEVFVNVLRNLRIALENIQQTQEMTWRTYSALRRLFPNEVPPLYESPEGSLVAINQWHADQIRQLDPAIQLVESWE